MLPVPPMFMFCAKARLPKQSMKMIVRTRLSLLLTSDFSFEFYRKCGFVIMIQEPL